MNQLKTHNPQFAILNPVSHGFSLLELMITLIILGIFITLSVRGMHRLFGENRAAIRLDKIVAELQYARSEAIKLGQSVRLCKSSDGKACGGNWRDGQIIVTTSGDILRVFSGLALSESLVFDSSLGKNDYLEFSPWGTTMQIGSFHYLQNGRLIGRVVISSAGRIRIKYSG